MLALTEFERYALSLAVPSLDFPALENADDITLWERAADIGYWPDALTPRGDGNLAALLKILGVVPSSYEERLAVIHISSGASI